MASKDQTGQRLMQQPLNEDDRQSIERWADWAIFAKFERYGDAKSNLEFCMDKTVEIRKLSFVKHVRAIFATQKNWSAADVL